MMTSVAAINNLGGHAHNPRGNLWFKDESTYGHKLLMKMGWNKGKGLGKNENGIQENIKVKFRSTNSGLGFKNDAHTNVMKTEYESILKNLSAEYSCSETANLNKNSGEEKPVKKSKVVNNSKLRYPKLFFGKDVTKYSEKDMKSIFICSTPLKSIEDNSKMPDTSDKKDFESDSPQSFNTYSNNLSISDYFAKKMEEKRNGILSKNCSSITSQQTSIESKNTEFSNLNINENKTSKRKQKVLLADIKSESCDVEELNQAATEIEGVVMENSASPNKKTNKKRKKKSKISFKDTEVNLNEIESSISNIGNDEKTENSSQNISYNNDVCSDENIASENSDRLNRKRKISQAFGNNSVESSEKTVTCKIQSSLLPTKKQKNSVELHLSPENSVSENYCEATEIKKEVKNYSLEPVGDGLSNRIKCSKKERKSKKKLKKKLKSCLKNKCGSYSLKNVSFNETVSYRMIDSHIESVDPLVCSEDLNEITTANEEADNNINNSNDDIYSVKETASGNHNLEDNVCAKEQDMVSEKLDKQCTLRRVRPSKLKRKSHYNAWIESQRLALKMKLYKEMAKSIKNHKILKTTNLLSIKGYGNWGYELEEE